MISIQIQLEAGLRSIADEGGDYSFVKRLATNKGMKTKFTAMHHKVMIDLQLVKQEGVGGKPMYTHLEDHDWSTLRSYMRSGASQIEGTQRSPQPQARARGSLSGLRTHSRRRYLI